MSSICISKGKLGSIERLPENGLEIKPLTVFIGKQGTGKSLLSQLSYFFYNLPYLISYQQASDRKNISSQELVRMVLDNLRSDKRAIGVFADPTASIEWEQYSVSFVQTERESLKSKEKSNFLQRVIPAEKYGPV